MALIVCPDCKTTVSEDAPSCPKCGCPNSKLRLKGKKKGIPLWVTLLIVLIVLFYIGEKCGTTVDTNNSQSASNKESSTTNQKPIKVTAVKLYKDYDANEVSADEKYKGKLLSVTGVITNISKTLGDLTVVLSSDNEVETILGVQCTFPESYKDSLAKLKRGETITVKGICSGKTLNVSIDVQ
jgi:ribosomal protein L40E